MFDAGRVPDLALHSSRQNEKKFLGPLSKIFQSDAGIAAIAIDLQLLCLTEILINRSNS